MNRYLLTLFIILTTFLNSQSFAASDFPGRAEFPNVAVYENRDLFNNFDNVIIVDTRSAYEFHTLQIIGAVNIPVSSKSFVSQVKQLREKSLKPIVFYCNGRSCFKSYEASTLAMKAGVKDTYAFDAGMFEWAQAYPEKAALLGKSPVSADKILSSDKFKKHLMTPADFGKVAFDIKDNSMILDIRDSKQRAQGISLFMGKERWASIDNPDKIEDYIKQARTKNIPIYIYDEVGKQVRWLQYALEDHNISNYYFMDNGAKGYLDTVIRKR